MSDGSRSPSLSSAPPQDTPQRVSADRLREHPLWAASRGADAPAPRGPRGARGPASPGAEAAPRYERLSSAAIAADLHEQGDGADSTINTDDEADQQGGGRKRRKRKKRAGSPSLRGRGGDGDADVEGSAAESDGGERRRDQTARLDGLLGDAAFGRSGGTGELSDACSSVSESAASSSRRREAQRGMAPIRGSLCVGCNLAGRMQPVDFFVRQNIGTMEDDQLWKMAALVFRKDVIEPSAAEGATVPAFPWKRLREHYELHSLDKGIQRMKRMRCLQLLRSQLEMGIVRVENGKREVDRNNAQYVMKCISLEEKLQESMDADASTRKKK